MNAARRGFWQYVTFDDMPGSGFVAILRPPEAPLLSDADREDQRVAALKAIHWHYANERPEIPPDAD